MENLDYLRGFGIQLWASGCQMTGVPVASRIPGFGASFKAEVKKSYLDDLGSRLESNRLSC